MNKLTPFDGVKYKVDTRKIQFFHPGDTIALDEKKFPTALPLTAIKFGKNYKFMRHALYAVVPVLENLKTQYLVVPCTELYRFYIGVSSRFCNALVRNTLDDYIQWKKPRLRMMTRLSKIEQFVSYRGFFDNVGKNWFQMPSSHIKSIGISNKSAHHEQQAPLVLKSTFPFSLKV